MPTNQYMLSACSEDLHKTACQIRLLRPRLAYCIANATTFALCRLRLVAGPFHSSTATALAKGWSLSTTAVRLSCASMLMGPDMLD